MTAVLSGDLVDRVLRRLADAQVNPTGPAIAQALRSETGLLASDSEMLRLIRALQTELVGAGPLQILLADPATTDVAVNGPDQVVVDRGSGWESTEIRFADDAAVARLARRLATAAGRRLDDAQPFVDARLPDGTRLHAVLAPISAGGTCISLRVLRPARHRLSALARALPGVTLPLMTALVQARLAFLVTGGTGSGKTTLLSALLSEVAATERVVVVEDAEELRPAHPHVLRLTARPPNVEGAGQLDLRTLVRQALRMRPDRLVVGEVRGAEVTELLSALNTGHDGGAGTVHANAAAELPARLEALAALAGMDRAALHSQLAGAIQVVLHMRRDGNRRELAEVGVVRREANGLTEVIPAVLNGRPVEPAADVLAALLNRRGVERPW